MFIESTNPHMLSIFVSAITLPRLSFCNTSPRISTLRKVLSNKVMRGKKNMPASMMTINRVMMNDLSK